MFWKKFIFVGFFLTSILCHEFDDDGLTFSKNETTIDVNITDIETLDFDIVIVETDETHK